MANTNNIYAALAQFRGQVKGIRKDSKNPQYDSKYASLDAIWEAIAEPLSKNGLSVQQSVERIGEPFEMTEWNKKVYACWYRVSTTISHSSGETIELPGIDIPCAINAQKIGAAITYGKRYTLSAALGLSTETDDDGNSISVNTQVEYIQQPTMQAPPAAPSDAAKKEMEALAKKIKAMKTMEDAQACLELLRPCMNAKMWSGFHKCLFKINIKYLVDEDKLIKVETPKTEEHKQEVEEVEQNNN